MVVLECVVRVRGASHALVVQDGVMSAPSLHTKYKVDGVETDKLILLEQQRISILHRFNDDLVYVWMCTARRAHLVAFKTHSQPDDGPVEHISPLFTHAVEQGFSVSSIQILHSSNGRHSFFAMHAVMNAKSKCQWSTVAFDMRHVLRYCEKVTPLFTLIVTPVGTLFL
jgi:hypothetical protein